MKRQATVAALCIFCAFCAVLLHGARETGRLAFPKAFPQDLPPGASDKITTVNYTMNIGNPYSWIDTTGGIDCNFSGLYGSLGFGLPFPFPFYNQTHGRAYVMLDGSIRFNNTAGSIIPFPSAGRPAIAPFCISPAYATPETHVLVKNVTAINAFVVEWRHLYAFFGLGTSEIATFQLVLFPSGLIIFNYQSTVRMPPQHVCGVNDGLDTRFYTSYAGLNTSCDLFSISLENYRPVAAFAVPSTTIPWGTPANIVFTGNPGTTPSWYYWDIDVNGSDYFTQNSTTSSVSMVLGTGTHSLSIILVLTDAEGLVDSTNELIAVTVVDYGNFTNTPPSLTAPAFTPLMGNLRTTFEFTTIYTDPENHAPVYVNLDVNGTGYPMSKFDLADINYTDGCSYSFASTLPCGFTSIKVVASDGFNTTETTAVAGPVVDPFCDPENATLFVDDFEGGLGKWVEASGLWHLTSTASAWPDPCRSPTHSAWFGQESTGTYNTPYMRAYGNLVSIPIDLSLVDQAYLEFYHWREGEGFGLAEWDSSRVYASVGGATWEEIYENPKGIIAPWERKVLNISSYCGSPSLRLKFTFDTLDDFANDFRGWLVDDVAVYTRLGPDRVVLSSPASGIELYEGPIDFSWTTPAFYFGIPEFTWQLSNTSQFTTILQEITGIPGTATSTTATITVDVPTGQYHWRVCPSLGSFRGAWSSPFVLDVVQNNAAPTLTNGSIQPSGGDKNILFTFSVEYGDTDDNPPLYVNVVINGSVCSMIKQNPLDIVYADGCTFTYSTYLAPGSYTYSFECEDHDFYTSTGDYAGLIVSDVNAQAPEIAGAAVSDLYGDNTTLFTFEATYFDADNDLPAWINITINGTSFPMVPVDPGDLVSVDGIAYAFTTSLAFGTYQFKVECSDGVHVNSSQWLPGPVVNPFFGQTRGYILLNEMTWSASSGFIEMYNFGPDTIVTGWTVRVYYYSTLRGAYTFPANWIFGSREIVVLHGGSGTNSPGHLYMNGSIIWGNTGLAFGIYDQTGRNVDWFQASDVSKPANVTWQNDVNLLFNSNYVYRKGDIDYNRSSDWVLTTVNSAGSLNPGQSGEKMFLVSPTNASGFLNGIVNFRWKSFDLLIGKVLYELEISPDTTFSVVSLSSSSILEQQFWTTSPTSVDLARGTYYWRVRGSIAGYMSNWSLPFAFVMIRNDFAPTITSPILQPPSGSQNTSFTFSAMYQDLDDDAPEYFDVVINGTAFPMFKVDPLDTNYVDGCTYRVAKFLTPGRYEYYFRCADYLYSASSSLFDDLVVNATNYLAPSLSGPSLFPLQGYNGSTMFFFTVSYSDMDNNPPSSVTMILNGITYVMVQVDPLDAIYNDGCVFKCNATLQAGTCVYTFECSDGAHACSIGPFTGPVVLDVMHTVEDFQQYSENEAIATVNDDWVVVNNAGSRGTFTAKTVGSSKFGYLWDDHWSYNLYATYAFADKSPLIPSATISYAVGFCIDSTLGDGYISILDEFGNVIINLMFDDDYPNNNPKLLYNDGSWKPTGISWAKNVVYGLKVITAGSDTFDIEFNGIRYDNNGLHYKNAAPWTASIGKFRVSSPASGYCYIYVDNIAVSWHGDLMPLASASMNCTTLIAGGSVGFTFNGSAGDAPAMFYWNFTDGSPIEMVRDPVHRYATAGIFDLVLTVVDADGDSNTVIYNDCITVIEDVLPAVSFISNATMAFVGDTISLSWVGTPGNTPATLEWDFGDGSAHGSGETVLHVYATAGNYTVTLVVTDADGDADNKELVLSIREKPGSGTDDAQPDASVLKNAMFTIAATLAVSGTSLAISRIRHNRRRSPPRSVPWTASTGA